MILTAPYTFQYAGDIFMKKMYGVTTPVVTPFTADNAVDTAALRQLTDFLISRGVHGLYPNGSTGEMNKMSVEERMLVAETVQDQAAGRIPVFVQVGAQTTADTLKLAKHAVQIGAAGIGVLTPQYMGVTDDELVYYYTTVSASIPDDFPVYCTTFRSVPAMILHRQWWIGSCAKRKTSWASNTASPTWSAFGSICSAAMAILM